ncbi:YutD family protein [Viridibacillus sp. YIM B01967]|uniref:YutD family protein n=1 Tax=Viridibacillus soli TaxID=2798301 RepID=A0ABS1HA34_9BACL|nr:YutD family protein [Viridibacillus soli]MBK3496161.1 YutD family protein [Viridibacillus soli]
MIIAERMAYDVLTDYREGFQEEEFLGRFSDILTKYDYIVGDWGYGQLRLKGFFDDKNQKASFDTKISTLQDYLYEFCNFGCAYFVLKKTGKAPIPVKEEVSELVVLEAEIDTEIIVTETFEEPQKNIDSELQ